MTQRRISAAQYSAIFSALLYANVVSAEDATTPAEGSTGLAEIVVSAQKRTENLQSVPVSVAAVDAASLVSRGVTSEDTLAQAVPALTIDRQARYVLPYLRGVGSQSGVIGNENAVATYVDGIYNPDPEAANMSFNNIKRIEVLRGPQGTLFGRNATGGLINIITRDPQAAPSADLSVNYGNYQTVEGNLYATGGTDTLAADLALYAVHQGEGFGRYILVPGQPEANFRKTYAARTKVLWTPTEDDRVTFIYHYSKDPSDIGLSRTVVPGERLFGGTPVPGTIWDSTNGTVTQPNATNTGAAVKYERRLGSANLTMLSAYEENNIDGLLYDNDAAPPHLTDVLQFTKSTSFQNEVYLNGTLGNSGAAGSLDWTAGLFVFNLHSQEYPLNIGSTKFLASNYDIFADQFTRSYAAYGQATYAITDTTRITAGARFTEDSRDFSGRQIAVAPNPTPAGTVLATGFGSSSENRPTYRVAVDQALAQDVLAYASFSTGFKAGTFNLTSIKAPAVGPETIKAYEVGIKSELFDHVLRLNAAAFYYNYNGVQLTTTQIGVTTYFNAANSHIKGGEAELTYAPRIPVGDLELNAGASYLDAQYTSFPNGQISTPLPTGGNSQVIGDLSGNTMIRAPKWSGNVSANYTLPMGPGELGFYANFYYTTLYYWDPDNRLRQPAYGLLNSDVSYSFGRDKQYKVKVYGKNLTNREYFVYQSAASLASVAAAGDPRTYGVGFEVKF